MPSRPTYTRKTYVMHAEMFAEHVAMTRSNFTGLELTVALDVLNTLAGDLASRFKADNYRFDTHKFLKACGF